MCVCARVCTSHAACLYSTARVCVFKLLQPIRRLGTTPENNICTVFPLGQSVADASLVTARYKTTRRFFDSMHFLQLESSPKQESWQKLGVCVCLCVSVNACILVSDRVCVVGFLAFLYPIQEEAEFCVTLVY